MTPKPPRNRLNTAQSFALWKWMEEFKNEILEDFKNGRINRSFLASRASIALDFEVKETHIKTAEKAFGIDLSTRRGTPRITPKSDRVVILARAVAHLFESMGKPVPDSVVAISKKRQQQTPLL